MPIVNGLEVQVITQNTFEDYDKFQTALLSSSFAVWANQSPAHSAAIAANFATKKFEQVKAIFSQLSLMHPPTQAQLQEWQAIANANSITSLRFADQ